MNGSVRRNISRIIWAAILILLLCLTGCGQAEEINEIDRQVNELCEQKDDLYAIKEAAEALFSTGASQVILVSDKYEILDENNDDISESYSDNTESLRLKDLLEKYRVIHMVFQENNALVLGCGSYLEDDGSGYSYQRRLVMTDGSFDEETIENYFDATAGLKDYDRKIDTDGVVVWSFDNGANKENIRAKRIYDDVWSFEKRRKDGILAIFSV